MKKHAVSLKWSDEDTGFIASIPGINALSAFGSTREKALSELKIAAATYLEALEEAGKPLPYPEKIIRAKGLSSLDMSTTKTGPTFDKYLVLVE